MQCLFRDLNPGPPARQAGALPTEPNKPDLYVTLPALAGRTAARAWITAPRGPWPRIGLRGCVQHPMCADDPAVLPKGQLLSRSFTTVTTGLSRTMSPRSSYLSQSGPLGRDRYACVPFMW